ncbi:MAG TPA: hypothetical protein VNF47_08855 [Streptosporangiaceae bacterium]|nr:hypothetical protein [Streptosporangiaceae bacterium]
MARLWEWLGKYADSGLALILAIGVGILALADIVGTNDVNGAILLCLGLVAASTLRNRAHDEAMEGQLQDVLRSTSDMLTGLPARLDDLESTVEGTRRALTENSYIRVLHGAEVGRALEEARRNTDRWVFKGGTGTFLRAMTLPECVGIARNRKHTLAVQIEILDPTDNRLCAAYALFRRSLTDRPDATGEIWTTERTQKEAFATVLAACWYRQHFSFVTIDVGLSAAMTTFRWDMTPHRLIITQEDPQFPAMMMEPGKYYYEIYCRELMTSLRQARQVPIAQVSYTELSDEPTVGEARKLFVDLDLPLPRAFTDRDVAVIIGKALQPKNPYV